jgi:hypothetical protein
MPKLLLKFQAAVIKEIVIEKTPLSIGRKVENDIIIDNLAVSGHHARVTQQGASYVIEDLQSTNGTLINGKRIVNAALKHGDQIGIGQHTLVFVQPETVEQQPVPAGVNADATIVMPPRKTDGGQTSGAAAPQQPERIGFLRLVEGKADQTEYVLSTLLTYIGKSDTAVIKLRGFFAPDIAALISKRQSNYILTAIKEGFPKLNGQPVVAQVELKEDDLIDFSGLKFIFHLKETIPS